MGIPLCNESSETMLVFIDFLLSGWSVSPSLLGDTLHPNNNKTITGKKASTSEYEDTFMLHNTGSRQIKKPDYLGELYPFKTKCERCKLIVARIRSLLDESKAIRENEATGVCEHCKQATSLNTCQICDLIVSEFISAHEKTRERQQHFNVWLCKVNHLLEAIVDGESVCQHRLYRDIELERIYHAIKEPLDMRELDIDLFPNLDQEKLMSLQSMSENKELREELISKIDFVGTNRYPSSENLDPSPSEGICLCKYLKKKAEGGISSVGLISDAKKAFDLGLTKDQNVKKVHASDNNLNEALTSGIGDVQKLFLGLKKPVSKVGSKVLRSRYSKGKTSFEAVRHGEVIDRRLYDSEQSIAKKVTNVRKSASKKSAKLQKQTSEKHSIKYSSADKTSRQESRLERADNRVLGQYSSDSKDTENFKVKENSTKGVKEKENLSPEDEKKRRYLKSQSKQKMLTTPLRDAKELSEILLHKIQLKAENFKLNKQRQVAKLTEIETIRLKNLTLKNVRKIKKIIPLPSRDEKTELLVFGDTTPSDKKDIEEKSIDPESLLWDTQLQTGDDPNARRYLKYQTLFKGGAVKYQLSNEEFIRKGWTILPTEKLMRRMNIYRMEPANLQNCWFKRHQQDGELLYDSGQKLADIDHNGRGHWYYRNGTVALDYYNAQESNVGQRYVVYSSGIEIECGKIRPRTTLAIFDVLGHGVIYDLNGNVRLKYNQSEGVLVDPKIGPPSKWKWHTLNDPPVLQRVFIDKCLKERDPKLEQVKQSTTSKDTTEFARPAHPEMVTIELDNFVKQKRFKLKQKFRPFQIRFKSVKLNEQFSLKIVDQATIHLLYRDGVTRLKLNLGMLLKSDEIIDTVTSEVGDVSTPYDIRPAKTESVENIQKILKTARASKVHTRVVA